MDSRRYFSSNTFMGRDQQKKVLQLIQSLLDSQDSFEFRQPVDYQALGLIDYPLIVKKPMDLTTVKQNLCDNRYEMVEECLADIQLVWDNCKMYNTADNVTNGQQQWIYKQAEKLQKMTKKMIRNYVPCVKIQNPTDKRRGPKKDQPAKKVTMKVPQPQPKDYLQKKQEQQKSQQKVVQSQQTKQRKHFLMYVPLCSYEQVGVIFMLIRKYAPGAIEYMEDGRPNIQMEGVGEGLMKRLLDQLDMWGIGYVPGKKK